MVNKVLGAIAAFVGLIAAIFGTVFAVRRLQADEVADQVEELREKASQDNAISSERVEASAAKIRASVEAVGDDRSELAKMLDE